MHVGWFGWLWVGLGGAFGSMVRYRVGRLMGGWIPGVSSMLGDDRPRSRQFDFRDRSLRSRPVASGQTLAP